MTKEQATYMRECNKVGIRVYPVPRGEYYFLVVEFNSYCDFSFRADKIIEGKKMYHSKGIEWVSKIHELYDHYYNKKLKNKAA